MWSCGGEVGIAGTAKNPKVSVGWLCAMKSKEWSAAVKGFGWVAIEEVGGSMEGVSPINRGKTSLKQKGAHDVV